MPNAFQKLFESSMPLPAKPTTKNVLLAGLGGFIAIAVIALMADYAGAILILGSFGASCVIVFALTDTPLAQPRNVIAGHFLSSLSGLVYLNVFGSHWWALALSVATAIIVMMVCRVVHPPAGSNPVIVFMTAPSWDFLIFPTLAGTCVLVLIAIIYNNVIRKNKYPKYW